MFVSISGSTVSEGYSFLLPYLNFISYLYDSQPRVSQKPAIISTVQAPCFLFLILFYLWVCVSVLTKLNHPCSLSSASLALRVEPLALLSPLRRKYRGHSPNALRGEKLSGDSPERQRNEGDGERQEKLSWGIQLGNCLFVPLSSSSLLHLWLVNRYQPKASVSVTTWEWDSTCAINHENEKEISTEAQYHPMRW